MNYKIYLLFGFSCFAFTNQSFAQLYVNGGSFFIGNTAVVTVQGNVENSGTLTNNGTIEVQGNFSNSGAYTSTGTEGILRINGTGNSNINTGAATIARFEINKLSAADIVQLDASIQVGTSLTLTNGIFTTDPIANPGFAVIAPATVPFTFAAGKEIVGRVRRTSWTNNIARLFNQNQMQVTTTGGTAPTTFDVTMIPQSQGGNPTYNEREVKRTYNFSQTGGTAFASSIRFPYLPTELNTNTEANLVAWHLAGSEWNGKLTENTNNSGSNYLQSSSIPFADLLQEWKLADPFYTFNVIANLRGAWNSGTGLMNTNLTSVLPTTQPFNVSPFNYTGTETAVAIPANAVDWVLIEHRKPASGLPTDALVSSIDGRKAGFLLSNGTVVETDGIKPIDMPITKQGRAFVVVRHRNHLGVLSQSIPSNSTGIFSNNFDVLANSYQPVGAASNPVVLLPGSTKYGLWMGDANKNGSVNSTDVTSIRTAIAATLTGYQFTDINLSNSINSNDVTLTRTTISQSGGGSGTNGRPAVIQTNLPDLLEE